jgi:hypothetical protein
LRDDSEYQLAHGEFFFQGEPDEVPHGESTRVGDIAEYVGEVPHDLPNGQKPDQHLEKPQHRRPAFVAALDVHDPDRADGHVHDPGAKDKQWQNDPPEKIG